MQTRVEIQTNLKKDVDAIISLLKATGAKIDKVYDNVIHAIVNSSLINHLKSHEDVSSVEEIKTSNDTPSVNIKQSVTPAVTTPVYKYNP